MNEYTRELEYLRKASHERDHERIQFWLKKLFFRMNFYTALSIPLEECFAFVATFERYYPEENWARRMIVQITNMGIAPDETILEQAVQHLTAPGMANFFKSLHDICHSMNTKTQLEARFGYLVSAVEHAIMAQLVEDWYGKRTIYWERVQNNQLDPQTGEYSDPDASRIPYQFWTDTRIAQRDIELWLTVTDKISERINR